MPNSLQALVKDIELPGPSTQKMYLILSHLYLFPWFVRQLLCCELPLRPFLDANPDLELGGLPIAPKHTRHGSAPPYVPSLIVDDATEQSEIASFADDHSFPLVLKPLFGSQSRGIRKVAGWEKLRGLSVNEPMMLQPYVDAPREYGINIVRIGERVKIYGLTEITFRAVWGDGTHSLDTLVREAYDSDVADRLTRGDWVPDNGERVPLQTAADLGGCSFCDVTNEVTPALREACQNAADQINLRFGRFDVKAASLSVLKEGDFYILEANGSPSVDLTLYDERHSLPVKVERLRAHWNQLLQQAQPCRSSDPNTWRLLSYLLWFTMAPKRCATSFWNEVDDGKLAPGA
jgi:hypothetical protein